MTWVWNLIPGLYALLLSLFLTLTWVFAGELPAPPALKDEPVAEQKYFSDIHRHHNNWVEVTSNPNGSRRGYRMDVIVYNNASSYKVCINVSATAGGGTSWVCSANALTAP